MRVRVKSGQERKALVIAVWVTNVYIFVAMYSLVDSGCGTNYHHSKLGGMSENNICKRVWWARVTMGISKLILCCKYVGVIYTVGDCIIIIVITKWDLA